MTDAVISPRLNEEFAKCKTLKQLNELRAKKEGTLGRFNGELMKAYTLHTERISKEMKRA